MLLGQDPVNVQPLWHTVITSKACMEYGVFNYLLTELKKGGGREEAVIWSQINSLFLVQF